MRDKFIHYRPAGAEFPWCDIRGVVYSTTTDVAKVNCTKCQRQIFVVVAPSRTVLIENDNANVLSHAVGFLLKQDLALLMPGNWRPAEWAMTTSGWRQAMVALEKELHRGAKAEAQTDRTAEAVQPPREEDRQDQREGG